MSRMATMVTRNCERVGKTHCMETLNCRWNTLVQERSFPRVSYRALLW